MTAEAPLRAAVIGLGRMGMHHVRACADSEQIDLVAVLDHKPEWAVQVGAEHHCLVAADVDGLIGNIDIAIIAVPTSDHKATALPLLKAGVSCLVEKPIAASETEAQAMTDMAASGNAVLCVGHVERFNPAVTALTKALDGGDPIQTFKARRLNAPSDRTYDVDCVLDLMIHDLDLLNVLGLGTFTDISATAPANHDEASVMLKMSGGEEVHLEASRIAQRQHRDLRVGCGDTVYDLDYAARTLVRRQGASTSALTVKTLDPLRTQLAAFVDVVRDGGYGPISSGQNGYDALKLANQVRTALGLA